MSVLVWDQLAAGNWLSRQRQSATTVVEALLGCACAQNIIARTRIFFGESRLTSADGLLSMPPIGCPAHIERELARKGRVVADLSSTPTNWLGGRRIRGCDVFG